MRKIAGMVLLLSGIHLFAQQSVVTDNRNHLQWQDNMEHIELKWKLSKGYCSQMNLNGFNNWRIPTKMELITLFKNKKLNKQFSHLENAIYWSATEDEKDFIMCVRDSK